MCGILGIHNLSGNSKQLQTKVPEALSTLSKRGPDDSGIVHREKCTLAQTRLSILDLTGGHQPMKDTESNTWLSFNGEIYNFTELRTELEKLGHVFTTTGDTEVIIKTYKEYGEKCVEKLDGMFAFALWDEDKEILLLARDRFGKKPLYVHRDDDTLFFASEIKTLMKLVANPFTINPEAINAYLTLSYIPPTLCIYNEVASLLPAHYLIYKNNQAETVRYWELKNSPLSISYDDARSEAKRLLTKAVSKRMIADVEIGSLLSGGVDSSLVSMIATKYSDKPLKTFSIKYGDDIDETQYAKEVSHKINSELSIIDANSRNILEELSKIQNYLDEPLGDSSLFPQHIISELASSKVKVVLTGDGADELAMGYGWYFKYWNLSKKEWFRTRLLSDQFSEYIPYISIFTDKEKKLLLKNKLPGSRFIHADGNGALQRINNFDIGTYLPGQLLTKIDRTSMMHSLEVRSPFLDTELAEFIYNLPTEYKMDKHSGKIIIKDIFTDFMPKDFVHRKKQGFGAPMDSWLHEKNIREYVQTMILPNSHLSEYLNVTELERTVEEFYAGNKKYAHKIWTLLNLEIWLSVKNHS